MVLKNKSAIHEATIKTFVLIKQKLFDRVIAIGLDNSQHEYKR